MTMKLPRYSLALLKKFVNSLQKLANLEKGADRSQSKSTFCCKWLFLSTYIQYYFVQAPLTVYRGSQQRCFLKKAVLKNFAVFTGKRLRWSLFLIKLQAFRHARTCASGCFCVYR